MPTEIFARCFARYQGRSERYGRSALPPSLQQAHGRTMNLDLSSLRSVITAAEHGSFRQAATALNIKQSALSRRIRHLEEQLCVSLFDRSSGGVRLTPAGTSLAQAARRLFEEIDHMVKASQLADRGEAGVLKAGFATGVSTSKVSTVLADHIKSFPAVAIQVIERSPAQLIAALGSGDVDIAIIVGEARQHSGPSISLWSERIVAALSSRHPLSNSEVIDWSDLKGETFLLSHWDPGSDLRNLILKKLAAPGDAPRIETWDTSNENVLGMIEAGLHVSIHCESWTRLNYSGVRFRELRDASGPSHITFTACWEEHNRNPALARFLETLRQTHHPTTLT